MCHFYQVWIFIVITITVAQGVGNRYFVSPNGKDQYDGTENAPWQHIAFATCGGSPQCSCNTVNPHLLAAGDTLFLMPGTYKEHSILIYNSGTPENRIFIKAYPGKELQDTIDGEFKFRGFMLAWTRSNSFVTIDGIVFRNQYHFAISGDNVFSTNIVIQNCKCIGLIMIKPTDNSSFVYFADYINSSKIKNNILIGNDSTDMHYAGVIITAGDGHDTIINNDISHFGIGIYWKHSSKIDSTPGNYQNAQINNNFIHNCHYSGMDISNDYTQICNNLIINNGGGGIFMYEAGGGAGGGFSLISHNTIYNQINTTLIQCGEQRTPTGKYGAVNDTIKDNILYGNNSEHGSLAIWPHSSNYTDSIHNTKSLYNCYYNIDTNSIIREFGNTYSLSKWQKKYPTRDSISVVDVPKFVNQAGSAIEDFGLTGGKAKNRASDGTDMGADVGLIAVAVSGKVPEITSSPSATGIKGNFFSYTPTATMRPIKFSDSLQPSFLQFDTSNGTVSGTPNDTGTSRIYIRARNINGWSKDFILSASFGAVPEITSSPSAAGIKGNFFSYTPTATMHPIKYSDSLRPSFLNIDTSTGIITGTPTDTGIYKIHIRAWNTFGPSKDFILSITIGAVPEITSGSAAIGIKGQPFSYAVTATMRPNKYSDSLQPSFLKLDSITGNISGTPIDTGTYKIHLRAWNPIGPSNDFTLTITIGEVPQITSSPTAQGMLGLPFRDTIAATMRPNRYSDSLPPSFLKLDTISGIISGTPTDTGIYKIHIRAWNAFGPSKDFILSITIGAVPQITSNHNVPGTVGRPFTYAIIATMRPIRFSDSLQPSFFKLDSVNGIISGTPTDTGTFKMHIRAWNENGPSNDFILSIIVAKDSLDSVPQITSNNIIAGILGKPLSYSITATLHTNKYTDSLTPLFLKLDSATGVISGTPTDTGTFKMHVRAWNANGPSKDFILSVMVTKDSLSEIISSSTAAGIVGTPFTYSITATVHPLKYSDSLLPPFLKLDSITGIISGIPTDTGISTIHLRAWNENGPSNDFILSIIITYGSLSEINSQQYVHALVGHPFRYKIFATENPTSFSANGLPDSLILNETTGEIIGKPKSLSNSAVTLHANNKMGKSLPFSLNIFMINIPNGAKSTPISQNQDLKDSFEISNDTMPPNIKIFVLGGTGNNNLSLIPSSFSILKTKGMYPVLETRIPREIINSCSGFRASMIIGDSLSADTISLTRPLIRTDENCDNLTALPLSWTPLIVTALPEVQKPNAVLKSLFPKGSYDKSLCRLLKWPFSSDTNASWAEYGTIDTGLFDFKPGRLSWIKTRDTTRIDFGRAATTSLNDTFVLPIFPAGWTDFSIPFSFSIPLTAILSATAAKFPQIDIHSLQIYSWIKNSNNRYTLSPAYLTGIDSSAFLPGGAGHPYTVCNPLETSVSFYIPPICSAQVPQAAKVLHQAVHGIRGWHIRIKSMIGDNDALPPVYCGANKNLARPINFAVPPTFSEFSTTIYDAQTGRHYGHFIDNSQPVNGNMFIVSLFNKSSSSNVMKISIDDLFNLPQGFRAALFKRDRKGGVVLVDTESIAIKGNSEEIVFVGVGNQGYLKSFSSKIFVLPGLYGAYPNPFRNRLTIRYSAPWRPVDEIRFSLVDLLGKCIWTKTEKAPRPGPGEIPITFNNGEKRQLGSKIFILRFLIIENGKITASFSQRILSM